MLLASRFTTWMCLAAIASSLASADSVRLQNETIDTRPSRRAYGRTLKPGDKIDAALNGRRADLGEQANVLVQFTGPVHPDQMDQLTGLGARIAGYLPDHALLVRIEPGKLDAMAALPFVQWIGEYRSLHKLQPEVLALARRGHAEVGTQSVARARSFVAPETAAGSDPKLRASDYPDVPAYEQPKMLTIVLFDDADRAGIASRVRQLGGTVATSAVTRSGGLIRARLSPVAASTLAESSAVRWIEPYREPKLLNNVAAQGPRMNVDYAWTNFFLTGSNQIIAVCDTGLDSGNTNTIHPDFSNKIHRAFARGRLNNWSDPNGHGTHVSGSVLGSGRAYSNGMYKGIAHDARLVIQSVEDMYGYLSGLPEDLNDLFLEAYTNDARIHSDSWGASVDGAYTEDSRQADEFLWNHQDMLILFAAGNEGADSLPTGNPDGVVDEDSLSAPGTAKNVLTVGAAENARTNGGYSTRLYSIFGYPAAPLSNDLISTSYDGIHQGMAAFSSRGPCNDGRTKPDIVAPGTDIISCRSRATTSGNGWGVVDGTTNYMYSGGTSMSTPLTAGAAGLVRQYLVERRGITNPPGALIKAMMLNGARSLAPGQYGEGAWREIPDQARPNNVEGWGHVNLGETLQPPAGRTNALHTGQVATGQTNIYTFISTHTNTLSVVLAWHDYPGELAAAVSLVNDLDLRVTTPGGQVHLGNGVVGGDRLNNVEGLDIFPLTPGTTVVEVVGYNVPQGTNQPYALVIRESAQTYEFKLQRATHAPLWPTNDQAIAFQTFVQSGVGGVGGVTNFYRINTGTWVEVSASPVSGYGPGIIYTYDLGGQPIATRVDYYAVAYDSMGTPQVSATNSFYVADLVAFVKPHGAPVPPYNTWETAATNINDAVNAVIPGGFVWVTNGTYDGEVVIRKSCTVKSVNGAEVTIIDGRGSNRCVKMDGVVYSVLDGFTLTNGVTPNGDILGDKAGGGVLLREYAVVQNCIIRGNRGMYGGGAACYNSKFRYEAGTISNCVIEGNFADTYYGGGVRLAYGGYLTHSIVRDNRGADTAGGVYFEGLGGYMENSLIVGNVATSGLAVGGGVEMYGGGCMANCTIVSNSANHRGGVNFVQLGEMENTIVWSNRQVSGFDVDDETGHDNMIRRAYYSCAAGLSNSPAYENANTTNHPLFANFSAGDYRLTPASPCRDTGINAFWLELYNEYQFYSMEGKSDLDGTERIKNGIVDMGAYELLYNDTDAPLVTLMSPTNNSLGVDPATQLTLSFNENIHAGAGGIRLYRADGTMSQSFPASGSAVGIAGTTATITLTNTLAHTNAYYVLVDTNAFRDVATNWYAGITSTSAWNFTTRDGGVFATNTIRIDFGTNTTAETDDDWQAFPLLFTTTATSTSRVYALGTSSITVTVRSASAPTGRDRNNPADTGACTYGDMYRDLAQISSGGLTTVVSGVSAGAQIELRVWTYDYSFADSVSFSVRDVTDGRNNLLGTILNRTGASFRPTNNTMYSAAGSITAGTNGTLVLQITGDSGPARLNGLELNVLLETVVTTSTLTIASAHGMANPAAGVHSYANGEIITCVVTGSPVIQGATQFICTGWTGSGSTPASGSGTSVMFTITNSSTLTWLWTTNVESVAESNLVVDSAYATAVGDRIMQLDVDPQGRAMIVGSFTNIGAAHRQQIARLNSDGCLDTNLTVGAAYGDHDWALSVLCHTNGYSYVGGTMNGALGNFARYNANGSHDTSYLATVDNSVESLLQLMDGGLLAGGQFTFAMDEEHGGLARLNSTGGLVSAFATTLDNFDGGWNSVYALAQQADGKLLVGGDFKTINSTSRMNIGRIHLDGTLDTTFTNQLTGTSARVNCLLVQTNGLLAGGYFSHANGQRVTNLVRFTSSDTVDAGFAVYPNGRVNALLALPDGRTMFGGDFTAVNGAIHPGLAVLKSDGSLDASFTMGISGAFGASVFALHLDHDNGILVAGEFTNLGGVARSNLGRLMLGPSTNTPPSTNTSASAEYWAGINQDGHARNASAVTLDGDLRVRWARSLTNFNDAILQARTNYAGQRGNGLAIRDGRILALVPNATNPLAQAAGQYFASFGTFALLDGSILHETITPHLGAGTRGAAALQDSDTTYGYVNFYWNREDTVFTAYGADIGRSYAFDAYSGTLSPYTPFSRMAESPNGSGYFAMTYDNPRVYARGALNTHYSYSKARAGIVGQGELQIEAMKHYNAYLVHAWDVFGFTMTHYTDDSCFPSGLGTKISNYRFTNSPYGVFTNWTGNYPSNTFAGFGLHHVRGAPRPLALGADDRIYYYGFRNTMSGSTPTAADYASGMRLFAVNADNGQPLFEINTGWNPDADAGLASTATWGTQRYHYFLPQISVLSNRVLVLHPQVNQGHGTNLWTRGRLFCFDTATTSLAWSVTYTNNAFQAKVRMDDVVYNSANNASPNCMWGDNTEQAVQMTIAGSHGYIVDPGIQGGGASGPLQLTVHRYALADGSVTVTNLVPMDSNTNTITAYAERMVNNNDNTNRVALRELAAVDGALVALVDVDLKAQALVVIEGSTSTTPDYAPAAVIRAPFAGIPPGVQTFNDHRGTTSAKTNIVPVLNRLGAPQMQVYDTGTPIAFDASGSTDPDGGTLAYDWNFGDSHSGSGALTSHAYASWGGAPAISNITVRLTVTDNEGKTNTTSRTIWVRDVGNSVTTTLTASADGYIFTAGASSNSNFGTAQDLEIRRVDINGLTQEVAYIKFDLTGVDVSTVTDAILRVYVMTPQDFMLEAHATSNGWTESTLRGSNAPSIGVRLGDVMTSRYDPIGTWARAFHQWVEFPVTTHIKDTSYGSERSFAIVATNANASPLELASRNNTTWPGSAPKLILRTGSTGYGGPVITNAPSAVIVYSNTTTQALSIAATSSIGATNLAYSWRQASGPARATLSTLHSAGAGSTTVSIPPGGGVYVFRGMVDDGLLYNEAVVTFQETATATFNLSAMVNQPDGGHVVPASGTYNSGTVVQVTATASNGFSFVNWTGDASGSANPLSLTMDADKNITANFATNEPPPVVTNSLSVVSLYGTPTPSGVNLYTNGSVINASVGDSPIDQDTTQVVATGWTMSGNIPASGGGTNISLTLTNNATLTWLWQTNVLLQATAGANGAISSTGGWYALGGSVTVTAVADSGYAFAGWSGEVGGDTNANPLTLTLDRARSITASFTTNASPSGNGLIWRVDFNGSSNDTYAVSNFTGWTVSSTSRTQSFANVDGGSISSSITVRLLGAGTFTAFQRNMNVGSATNLYRDGGQNTTAMTLAISNLTAGAGYTLRLWYFDDEFALGTTQTYVNVTDGGSTTLGALTNTLTASAAGGHASLPSGLYDSRYVLAAPLTAGTNGQLNVSITPNTGTAKINGFELAEEGGTPPAITYTLTANVNNSSAGSVSPAAGVYPSGTVVEVTAIASNGYGFVNWTGDASGTNNPLSVTMDAAKSITAVFESNVVAQTKKLFVVLLGGQSNARGYGYQQYLVDTTNVLANPQTDVDFYFSPTAYLTQNVLTNLMSGSGFPEVKGVEGVNKQYPPQSAPVNRFGPELSLGRTIRDRIQVASSKVAVIKFAQSGTSLYNDWKPDGTTNKTADGTVYQSFQTTVRNGLTALTNAYPDYQLEIIGMGWVQGEADAVDAAGTNYLSYQSNLTTFITDIRATYGSNIIFALSMLSSNQYPITHLTEVRAAQAAVAATVANTYATETLGTNYPVATGFAEAGLHYLSTAIVQIGVDLANAIMDGTPLGGVHFALTSTVNNVSWGSVSPSGRTYSSGMVVQVTATASNGYHFANWSGDASGTTNPLSLTMDAPKSITAVFEADSPLAPTTNTLTVISAYGTPTPSGTNLYTNGSAIACAVGGSPVDQGSTQVFAMGWTLAGNSPTSGSTTNFSLTLTNDATLTWLWQTNVLLQATAGANGTISSTGGWYALGGSVTVTAVADSGYAFAGWSGEVTGDTNANPLTLTLDRARSITASFTTNASPSGNGLTWRVDLNGANSDTLVTSNFTGWTVSSANRTQSFANVDGGSINSSITVRLLGSGTFSVFERTMNAGNPTNLYRDGGQNTAAMTLAISNLPPGASYTLRIWYFDDEFSIGATQSYVNVTDGGSAALGALTNTLTANAAGGHANLPNSLYDSRYMLATDMTAGTNGQIHVSITPSAGNAKINAFELMEAGGGGGPSTFTLSVYASNGGSISPTGGTYAAGTDVQIIATPSNHFQFMVWTGAITSANATTNILMNANKSVWAVFAGEWLTQTVVSAHSSPAPSGGFVTNYGSIMTNSVDSPVVAGNTQYFCIGWTLSGNEPSSGTTNSAVVTLTNSALFTWLWTTNVSEPPPIVTNTFIVYSAYGVPTPSGTNLYINGSVINASIAGSPIINGSTTITCTGWTMSGNAPASGNCTSLAITLTNTATLTWLWSTNTYTPPITNGHIIYWSSIPGARYAIEVGTNIADAFTVVATNIAATPAMNIYTAAQLNASPGLFIYRIRKE